MMSEDLRSVALSLSAILAVAIAIVGCGSGGGPETAAGAVAPGDVVPAATDRVPDETELTGAWLLEDLEGRGVMDMVQTTLVFDDEGRVSGSGGCNRFTGSYTFTDGELSFGPLAGTKMMCPEAVMDQEDRFHKALGAVDRVAVDGPFLLIYAGETDAPLKFTRMGEDQNN